MKIRHAVFALLVALGLCSLSSLFGQSGMGAGGGGGGGGLGVGVPISTNTASSNNYEVFSTKAVQDIVGGVTASLPATDTWTTNMTNQVVFPAGLLAGTGVVSETRIAA